MGYQRLSLDIPEYQLSKNSWYYSGKCPRWGRGIWCVWMQLLFPPGTYLLLLINPLLVAATVCWYHRRLFSVSALSYGVLKKKIGTVAQGAMVARGPGLLQWRLTEYHRVSTGAVVGSSHDNITCWVGIDIQCTCDWAQDSLKLTNHTAEFWIGWIGMRGNMRNSYTWLGRHPNTMQSLTLISIFKHTWFN